MNFVPDFSESLKSQIINQSWFPLDWKKDPTISSMLTMLDAIAEKFADLHDIWQHLKNGAITFYFLPIKDMGLTDELYIKMNSRGKPLTQFEHFKAELERCIRVLDNNVADRVMSKIDREWTDLLWQYRNSRNGIEDDSIIDDEFLRYFKFVCDSYKVKRIEDNSIIDTVEISQDKNGIDKEDRVQKLKNYLSSKTIPKTIP